MHACDCVLYFILFSLSLSFCLFLWTSFTYRYHFFLLLNIYTCPLCKIFIYELKSDKLHFWYCFSLTNRRLQLFKVFLFFVKFSSQLLSSYLYSHVNYGLYSDMLSPTQIVTRKWNKRTCQFNQMVAIQLCLLRQYR